MVRRFLCIFRHLLISGIGVYSMLWFVGVIGFFFQVLVIDLSDVSSPRPWSPVMKACAINRLLQTVGCCNCKLSGSY